MLKRLKLALVQSFVGAIALGWLLAQGIMHFANIFTAPLADWIARRGYREFADRPSMSTSVSFQGALPELARSVSLLLLCYILLRWLYFKPVVPQSVESNAGPSEQG
jgi:hypothetical protein